MIVVVDLYCHPPAALESTPRIGFEVTNKEPINYLMSSDHRNNKSSRKLLLKFLFNFCQVMEKGTSELTRNAEFISDGLSRWSGTGSGMFNNTER